MKRATLIWLIVAGALVLVGTLGFVGIMAANHWDVAALNSAPFETNTVRLAEEFDQISIRSDTADILFVPSEDGTCKVVFYEQPKVKHTATVQDGTLSILATDTRLWYERISFSLDSPKMTVYLPGSTYASLFIEESTGEIELPENFSFGEIQITASTGNTTCHASASGLAQIKTSTGYIRTENSSFGSLRLSASTGSIDVRTVHCEGDLEVTVSTGKASLSEVQCNRLISQGSTGDITMENVIAEGEMSIRRDTGDVRFDACDAAELQITTDTGDVTGSLRSEKVFVTQSDTGRIQVPETTGGGKCKITTDTGDIRIQIKN